MKEETRMNMKKLATLALFLAPAVALAQTADFNDNIVTWSEIVGVITAPNVDNPVAGISAGTAPWSTRSGRAFVNLTTGDASFDVEDLVLNGGNASGTPGPIDRVTGTLVCNPGTKQLVLDTSEVKLTARGNARFHGVIRGIPNPCDNPLFLVRIGPSFPGAHGRWLATGAGRSTAGEGSLN